MYVHRSHPLAKAAIPAVYPHDTEGAEPPAKKQKTSSRYPFETGTRWQVPCCPGSTGPYWQGPRRRPKGSAVHAVRARGARTEIPCVFR